MNWQDCFVGKFFSDTFSDHDSFKMGDIIKVNVLK